MNERRRKKVRFVEGLDDAGDADYSQLAISFVPLANHFLLSAVLLVVLLRLLIIARGRRKEPARWPSNAFLLRLHRRAAGEMYRSSPSKNASSDCNHPDCPSTISKKSVRFSGKHEFTLGRRHQLKSKRGILVLHQVTLCVINADCVEWRFCLE